MTFTRDQRSWIDQLLHRFRARGEYRECFESVFRANHEDTWPRLMQTLQHTQPGWFQ